MIAVKKPFFLNHGLIVDINNRIISVVRNIRMRSFIIPKTEVSGGSCGVSTGAINNNDENDDDDAGHTWVNNDASVQSEIVILPIQTSANIS